MTKKDYQVTMTAVEIIALKQFSNDELAAFNLALHFQGKVIPENLAFDKAVKFKLIQDDGNCWDVDTLKEAADYVINQRIKEGKW